VWCREISEDDERAVYEFGCSDNGIGMSEEFAGHAFEMFSQENKTSRTQYEGTGLGLAIAKKITERLGGTIEIKSKKNCGTTVTMTIPFKTGVQNLMQYTENVNTESTEDIPLEGLHALIAEDNELNLEIAKLMLEETGICVECAADGKEAVAKFEESEPGYYCPSGIPVARILSLIRIIRSAPIILNAALTIDGWICTPSQIISAITCALSDTAPTTPGSR